MSNKLKKLPLFYKIYFSCLSIFVLLLIASLIGISAFISDYNKGIPETVSEKFFTDTFVNLDTDKIIEMSMFTPSEFETTEDIKALLEKTLSGDLTYTSISSDTEEKKYIVKSGEYKCASFTLLADENNDYHPTGITLHLPKEPARVYKILDSSSLYLNGVKVSEKYITSTEEHISSQYLPDDVTAPKWNIYTIDCLTKLPEEEIIDRNSNSPSLYDEDSILTEQLISDPEEKEVIDRIVAGAKQYAICMQDDAPKSSVYPYFEPGTDLYNSIRSVLNIFVLNHSGYAIEDEKISEFFRYDENTVSVRVSFTHVLKKYGQEDYKDLTDITYFARNVGGKYLIFARHNNI